MKRYGFLFLSLLCYGAAWVVGVWSMEAAHAGDFSHLGWLVTFLPLIYTSYVFYWKYQKPSVDAWLG